ncbi:MAG: hypothetical protein NTZ13_03595 [Candidatus Parcubacteria bacterium]|nr:hypothetical protein [Candidatus Parcubacteria bacterium]
MKVIKDKKDALDELLEMSKRFRGCNDPQVIFASAVLYTLAGALQKGTTDELAKVLLEHVTRDGEVLRKATSLAGNIQLAPESNGSKRLN